MPAKAKSEAPGRATAGTLSALSLLDPPASRVDDTATKDEQPLAATLPDLVDAATLEAARALVAEGTSPNTIRSYQTALAYWAAWHRLAYGEQLPFPVGPDVVLRFIVDHRPRSAEMLAREAPAVEAERQRIDAALVAQGVKRRRGVPSLATLQHRLAVLAKMHSARRVPSPCSDPGIREVLRNTALVALDREVPRRARRGLSVPELERLLATCDDDGLAGVRDRALLLFGFASGGRRRSEIAGAQLSRLTRRPKGDFVYEMGRTKSDGARRGKVAREDRYKPIKGSAAAVLDAWLAAAKLVPGAEGPLFRRIVTAGAKNSERRVSGKPLTGHRINEMIKRRALAAGLNAGVAAHSLRRGFITEGLKRGKPLPAIMLLSGHKTPKQAMQYYAEDSAMENPSADLFDEGRSDNRSK